MARGAKGWGWYVKYKNEGNAGFTRNQTPTPFDWSQPINTPRKRAFFDMMIGEESIGRVEFELANDILPLTCTNFLNLCGGKASNADGKSITFKGTKIHALVKGVGLLGGDVENMGGKLSHSSYGRRYFRDEGFFIPHSSEGLLTMANNGVDSNGSQFYITVGPTPHMNGKSVAFGRVVEGMPLIKQMFSVFSVKSKPMTDITISDCNEMK
eukprot:CAMPEP_0171454096 /NCGR_PEP_ID=MMETSP0945-20130129/1525_1 /TAXON_ID=109269 /ORGANISM="Vaucheria litorea, Strain CCMP2940" /LENGTH=210 /DNA_ID=CAMNT_0011979063 /DNA_START=138 /DNA_END=767 /DNA_ORIENTATION=+